MKHQIAVLITCYNRKEKTMACLKNLFRQTGLSINFDIAVFLTDDGSTDGTSDAVAELYPQVNVIKGNGNLYWNRGMHLAWTSALNTSPYDYYLWLNDDTDLMGDAIQEMLATENKYKGNAVVCGAVCSAITGEFTYGGRMKDFTKITPNGAIQDCFFINGNCVLVSKEIVETIGILDPIYPHAIGDMDYGLKVLVAGKKNLTTAKYVGYCESHTAKHEWCYSSTPILRRFKVLYSPLGISHPRYYFIFEKRYFSLFRAIKHYFSINLRALIPSLWK